MEWVASTLHTTSEHGVVSINTADAHTSAASSRLNWRLCRFKWTRPFRRKTKSGFCACAITFQLASTNFTRRWVDLRASTDKCGLEKKLMLLPEFEPRTVQPVASRYTECTITATNGMISQMWNANDLNRSEQNLIECCNGCCVEVNKIPGNFRAAPYSVQIRSTQLSNTSAKRCCDTMVLGTIILPTARDLACLYTNPTHHERTGHL